MMGYYNPIYARLGGVDRFLAEAAEAGVDGLIVVDLPPEEDELAASLRAHGVAPIRLATPTTDAARLPAILEGSSGFLYYVSVAGITGNLVDRLVRPPGFGRGHVVDFIDYFGLFIGNVADIVIVVAAAFGAILAFRGVPLEGGVHGRHEAEGSDASYAADGYARMKGAGALIVTYGVGDLAALVVEPLVLGAGDFALSLGGFTLGGIGTATFGAILLHALLNRRPREAGQTNVTPV